MVIHMYGRFKTWFGSSVGFVHTILLRPRNSTIVFLFGRTLNTTEMVNATIFHDDPLESIIEKASSLKFNSAVTSIRLSTPPPQQSERKNKALVDCVVDLLKTNPSIKCLNIDGGDVTFGGVRMHLYEALGNGEAGDNLEHLDVTSVCGGNYGALMRYLSGSRNLKSLKLKLYHDDPSTLTIVSSLVNSKVTSLHLYAKQEVPWLQELGSRLRLCTLISTLCVTICWPREETRHGNNAFLTEGVAYMPGLKHFVLGVHDRVTHRTCPPT